MKHRDRAWLYVRLLAGRLFNLAGVPGTVRDCDYDGSICQASISVRVGELFTKVRVNGLDVYFHRLTGKIDGIGFSPTFDCKLVSAQQSVDFGEPPAAPVPPQVQIENQSANSE
jgi:hypothetical protein